MKILFVLCFVGFISTSEWSGKRTCPKSCNCLESFVDCSDKDLNRIPVDTPSWTEILDLTNNNLQEDAVADVLKNYPNLNKLKFDWNLFTDIPIRSPLQNLSILSMSHNKISSWSHKFWSFVPNLKDLDVSNNKIEYLFSEMFSPNSDLLKLSFNNNKISNISKDAFDGFGKLKDLKLSRNHLAHLGKSLFIQLSNLHKLELNHNRFTRLESLTFKGLKNLFVLKIRQNYIGSLEDGSFFGLQNLQILKLDNNKIERVSKGWTYGLTSLQELYLGLNRIGFIENDAWDACKHLKILDFSFNDMSEIRSSSFEHLKELKKLKLNNNVIEMINEGAFNSTPELRILDLARNKISWLIEDTSGVFIGLQKLEKLVLAANEITSINPKAFYGLTSLSELDLSGNNIKTIQENPFLNLPIGSLLMNSSSLICDCSLAWLQIWLTNNKILLTKSYCAYPHALKGINFTSIPVQAFLCSKNESLKPIITQGPESGTTILGSKMNISCSAWSSSNSSLNFKWKQNNNDVDSHSTIIDNSTSILQFSHVMPAQGGKYQCIVSNDFGTVYSKKATVKVLVLPVMTKKPGNLTIKAGSTAKLECAATGEPPPQVGWQKDGGNEFPAAQERRLHVMPSDDVFFIINAKPIDSGLYSCIAQNSAGKVMVNATLTVQEAPRFTKKMEDKEVKIGMSTVFECMGSGFPQPDIRWWKDGALLSPSYRHFMTAAHQLLIITDIKDSDAGLYQCEISNLLGAQKTSAYLSIKSGGPKEASLPYQPGYWTPTGGPKEASLPYQPGHWTPTGGPKEAFLPYQRGHWTPTRGPKEASLPYQPGYWTPTGGPKEAFLPYQRGHWTPTRGPKEASLPYQPGYWTPTGGPKEASLPYQPGHWTPTGGPKEAFLPYQRGHWTPTRGPKEASLPYQPGYWTPTGGPKEASLPYQPGYWTPTGRPKEASLPYQPGHLTPTGGPKEASLPYQPGYRTPTGRPKEAFLPYQPGYWTPTGRPKEASLPYQPGHLTPTGGPKEASLPYQPGYRTPTGGPKEAFLPYQPDHWTPTGYSTSCNDITGVMIISIVCCAVGTSAVWVIIIYQTRKQPSSQVTPKDIIIQRTNLDNKSENSSTSKDSGTGNSTKRSTENLCLEVIGNEECSTGRGGGDVEETVLEINAPLLDSSQHCCEPPQKSHSSSSFQRESTRSNHERCKNHRPFSTPLDQTDMPLVHTQVNKSSCYLFDGDNPTPV